MKKIIFFLGFSLFFSLSLQLNAKTDCSKFPQRPVPPLAVNDFANIIDNATKESLEQTLRNYFNQTTIALVIVTVNSLGEETVEDYAQNLFDCWGPGGKNNAGILLLVAPNDRKVRIHTGYGIEGSLPDADCKKIIDENILPYFKKGNYPGGIANGVSRVLAITGPQSMEQRHEAQRIKDEESKRRKDAIVNTVVTIIVILVILIGLFFLIRWILNLLRKRKLRTALQKAILQQEKEIKEAKKVISELFENCKSAPTWAQKEANEHMDHANQKLKEAEVLVSSVYPLIKNDPDQANIELLRARSLINKAETNFIKVNEDLRNKVRKFSDEVTLKAKFTGEKLTKNIQKITGLISKGYHFQEALIGQNDLKKLHEESIKNFGNKEYDRTICEDSDIIQSKSDELLAGLNQILQLKENVDEHLGTIVDTANNLRSQVGKFTSEINTCKDRYPENVWKNLEVQLYTLTARITPEKLEALQSEIQELNNMKNQKFHVAASKYEVLTNIVTSIEQLYTKIDAVCNEQEEAKKAYPSRFESTKVVVNAALNKVKDADVSSETKRKAKDASIKLKEANVESGTSIVDWLILMTLLNLAHSQARDASRQAENDIEEAEERRRKKREEEAAERRRNSYVSSSYSSFSSFSSGSSSSGSSGGFGGFGGGSSGGGGASGSW